MALTDLTAADKNAILAAELKLKDIDVFFMDLMVPDIFTSNNPRNIVVLYENGFQNMCAAIESIGASTQGLTLLQLYAKLNYYKETNGPKNQDDE